LAMKNRNQPLFPASDRRSGKRCTSFFVPSPGRSPAKASAARCSSQRLISPKQIENPRSKAPPPCPRNRCGGQAPARRSLGDGGRAHLGHAVFPVLTHTLRIAYNYNVPVPI
jgi:hypothetical protein